MTRLLLAASSLLFVTSAPHVAVQQTLFSFHSAFWMNLHTYLHALSRTTRPLPPASCAALNADEQRRWDAGVASYRTRHGSRSLLFDGDLVRLTNQIAASESAPRLAEGALADEDRRILESVAEIYRRCWWPEHDKANRTFIAAVEPLLAQHGAEIAKRLAETYDTTWPSTPVRVDLVYDAGPPGNAYTTNNPTRVTIAAGDPRHHGIQAIEVLFHEASHGWDSLLMKGVSDAARRLGRPAPRDLWHALLFYTAGAITTEVLTDAGIRGYEQYADREGLFTRVWGAWRPAIGRHWPLFLRGDLSRDETIARILRELP